MNSYDDVRSFMRAGDQQVHNTPSVSDDRVAQGTLYMKLVKEEFEELMRAWGDKDLVEVADACADLKWVIEGLEHSLGIPQQAVWDEVARSNMSKLVDGKLIKREDGKVLKPDTFIPPNIKKVLES
jgi:predicted HAD superfamily Cof-like phosphohydrolase